MNRENKQNNIEKIEHRRSNKSKRIRNNLCLIIGIIVLILIVGTSFAVIKTTKTEVNVLDNLSGDTTEDVWQITSVSDEEETENDEVGDETIIDDDSEVSAISEETDDESADDGVSAIAGNSDYTITVTEYTGDTLEAEFDYENGVILLYVVDGVSLEQMSVTEVSSDGVELNQFYEEKIGYGLNELYLYRWHTYDMDDTEGSWWYLGEFSTSETAIFSGYMYNFSTYVIGWWSLVIRRGCYLQCLHLAGGG